VRGLSGGLCGLASLYQALENTIYTVSQLTLLTYGDMRAAMAEEMGSNATATATLTDTALLEQYYACKLYIYITRNCISKEKMLPKVTLFCLFKKWRYIFDKVLSMGNFFSDFGMVEAETQRQATQHDCFFQSCWAMGISKVKKCAARNIIFCTGLTGAAKMGQILSSIYLAQAQRTNQGRTPFI
jgi:hypothetical protein